MSVVIIGGGVIGLMTARELALAGREVVLLERGEVGREASWAGGGIVSPLYPWRYSPAVTALAFAAQEAYPQLTAELLEETGMDAEFFRSGMLMLDADDEDIALAWAQKQKALMVRENCAEISAHFPGLAAHWQSGLWMPHIANIRNPRLLKALQASLQKLKVKIYPHTEVVQWQRKDNRVVSVHAKDGRIFTADEFVVCSGAWSAGVLQSAGVARLPLRPVRGQMLQYRLAPGALPCIVLANGRYLIPRRDGHVLCGSTLEETGFDQSTTEEAYTSLVASAEKLWPALRAEKPVKHWAGLRPATREGIPFIGRIPDAGNLWVNAGQFRNGLVLAPASAQLLADQLLGRNCVVDPAPYQVNF
jgi:glycine oxidase